MEAAELEGVYDNYEEDRSQSLPIIGECLELQKLNLSADSYRRCRMGSRKAPSPAPDSSKETE
jgi:hypothetical protein